MAELPSDYELLKLVAANWTTQQIADRYGVTRQGVEYRLHNLNIRKKGPKSLITSILPWDITNHPKKRSLTNQAPFRGLRYFLQKRKGERLSNRAELDLRAFLNHVRDGKVLALDDSRGFVMVPREPRDGNLVVRWPEGVPQGPEVAYFELDLSQDDTEAEANSEQCQAS